MLADANILESFSSECYAAAGIEKRRLLLVVHENVVDCNDFREEHPGGASILDQYVGVAATGAFEEQCHSDSTRRDIPESRSINATSIWKLD